jgi:segregation and condensation protein B
MIDDPRDNVPPSDAPHGDVPSGDAPVGDTPVGDTPVGDALLGNAPPIVAEPSGSPSGDAVPPALREPDEPALRLAEAAVFASVTPMTARALSQILPDEIDADAVVTALRSRYQGRGIELAEIGGGLQFRTAADLAPQLRKVVQVPRRLPRVALETLAIVAWHQPVTRPEIEDIRGTALSQQTLDLLLENDLIVARGRKETPGRPTLWGTTPKFLEYFGLRDIRELPRRQDLLLEPVRPGMVPPEAEPELNAEPESAAVEAPPDPVKD